MGVVYGIHDDDVASHLGLTGPPASAPCPFSRRCRGTGLSTEAASVVRDGLSRRRSRPAETDATATAATQIAATPNATWRDNGRTGGTSEGGGMDRAVSGDEGEGPAPSALIAASASTTP